MSETDVFTRISDRTDPSAILTTAEAAQRLRVSPKTMAYWRTTGDGPPFLRFGTRTVRYRLSDLAAYMDESRRVNTLESHTRRRSQRGRSAYGWCTNGSYRLGPNATVVERQITSNRCPAHNDDARSAAGGLEMGER